MIYKIIFINTFLFFLPILKIYSQGWYVLGGLHKGQYTYGLRNFEALLENYNFQDRVIKPFNYKNQFKGFTIGGGKIYSNDKKYFGEISWTHHRNFYSYEYEYEKTYIDNNPNNDRIIDFKERLNYLTLSFGLMFLKYAYIGTGLDLGKLSILQREYKREESSPKFTRYWHGDGVSPGGRYTALTFFIGLMPYYKLAAVNLSVYYQMQLLPSSMMHGTLTKYYCSMSNVGIKTSICLGNFKNIEYTITTNNYNNSNPYPTAKPKL